MMQQCAPGIKQLLFCSLLLLCAILLVACGKAKTTAPTGQVITVEEKANQSSLYFSGTVKPIEVISITSPVDGTVNGIFFKYGQKVNRGDPLVTIKSTKLVQDYQDTLTAYLQSKEKYSIQKTQFEGYETLYKSGLVSRNDYQGQKQSTADAYLEYKSKQRKLQAIVDSAKEFTDELKDVANLSLENTQAVQDALNINLTDLTINSSTFGVTMMPESDGGGGSGGGGGGSSIKELKDGMAVKQNDTLLSVGDFTGLAVGIQINEIDINDIKPGQPVTVTGVAFPDVTLHGFVGSIDVQASNSQSGGLPTFPVEVVVPSLTKQQRDKIHIGMSAKVQMDIQHPANITVPINAVVQQNGQTLVKLITDPKTNATKLVPVITGAAMMNAVIIKSGLKAGDKILVGN